jgi:hypothetical protein
MIHSEGKYLLYGLGVGKGTVVTTRQLIQWNSDLCEVAGTFQCALRLKSFQN